MIWNKKKTRYVAVGIYSERLYILYVEVFGTVLTILDRIDPVDVSNCYSKGDLIDTDNLVKILKMSLDRYNIKCRDVRVSYGSYKSLSKIIKLSDMPEKDLDEYILFEYGKNFNNRSDENFIFDYEIVGKVVENSEMYAVVNIVSVPKFELSNLMDSFRKFKYKVKVIDDEISSLKRSLLKLRDGGDADVFIRIGKSNTTVGLLSGNSIVFLRDVGVGYGSMLIGVEGDATIDMLDIVSYPNDIYTKVYDIMSEIQESFDYIVPTFNLGNFSGLLIGEDDRVLNMVEFLSGNLEIDFSYVSIKDAFTVGGIEIVNVDGRILSSDYMAVLGVVLREMM